MATYKPDDGYRRKRKGKASRTPLWIRGLDVVVFVVSVGTAIALMVALMSQYINPNHGWVFPIMGLLSPIIYMVGVAVALYWIIRWRWQLALPMIVLLLVGANRVSLIVKVPFTRDYNIESYSGTLKVMSYNVRDLRDDDWRSTTSEVAAYIREQHPDIICLQEVIDKQIFDSINDKSRYYKYTEKELAIYSRYEIVGRGESFDHQGWESGSSIYADVVIKRDTIRVFNNHLHSTNIKREDNEYLTTAKMVRDGDRSNKLSDIVQRLQANTIERQEQVLLLADLIASTPYDVIVCGDFNDTPISMTYNKLSQGLTDSFRACGSNYSYTFRGFFNLLRIDYILTSPRISPRSYEVDRTMRASDHLPVVVRVKIEKPL